MGTDVALRVPADADPDPARIWAAITMTAARRGLTVTLDGLKAEPDGAGGVIYTARAY